MKKNLAIILLIGLVSSYFYIQKNSKNKLRITNLSKDIPNIDVQLYINDRLYLDKEFLYSDTRPNYKSFLIKSNLEKLRLVSEEHLIDTTLFISNCREDISISFVFEKRKPYHKIFYLDTINQKKIYYNDSIFRKKEFIVTCF